MEFYAAEIIFFSFGYQYTIKETMKNLRTLPLPPVRTAPAIFINLSLSICMSER